MRAQEYKRAIELYSELRELPEGEWAAALESACGGNAELSAEVMRLLHADRSASREQFLDRPVMEDAAQMLDGQFGCLPATGTLLGRYRIGARIGAGGMGVVYEARDERLDRRVGLKILPLSSSPGAEERIRRFEREARVISQLNHPNIISIFDADFDQGCYFIAMEFVEGQTLRSVIDGSTPGPDAKTVLEIVSQTASALAAAHEAGIVHRDIKPENIMLRPDGLVKILDFGLAAIRDPLGAPRGNFQTRPGQLAGTVQYLAPEQVAAKAATPRSDLFSLGVVAYELATGVRPFDGPSDGMIFNAILNVAPRPPSIMRSGIAPELDALVMGMIEKDPELRYQTANDVRSACRRLMRDSGSAVPPGRAPASRERMRTPRGVSRGAKALGFPLVSIAASVLLMAAVALLAWYAWPQPTPRVTRNVQVTNGEPVTAFVNDGTRLYYSVGKADSQARFLQVSTHGGQPKEIPEFRGMLPLDISADHSEILLGALGNGDLKSHALWTGPVLGGTPRRVGDLYASFAHWSSRGDQIVFTIGNDVRIAASDGSGARVLFHVNIGVPTAPFFFDADHRICFELGEENGDKVWQMNADGRDPHRVLPTWEGGLQNEAATVSVGVCACASPAKANRHVKHSLSFMRAFLDSPCSRIPRPPALGTKHGTRYGPG
jgi:predicted Ser/Thr protein kinase